MNKTIENLLCLAIGVGMVWGSRQFPSRLPNFTEGFLENQNFIAFDLDGDGSVDALGYTKVGAFNYAIPCLKDSRVAGYTHELTPEKLAVANAYFKLE